MKHQRIDTGLEHRSSPILSWVLVFFVVVFVFVWSLIFLVPIPATCPPWMPCGTPPNCAACP